MHFVYLFFFFFLTSYWKQNGGLLWAESHPSKFCGNLFSWFCIFLANQTDTNENITSLAKVKIHLCFSMEGRWTCSTLTATLMCECTTTRWEEERLREDSARSAVGIYVSCSNWILNLFQIFWIEMYWRINMFDNSSVWCLMTWLIKCITVTWSHQWRSRSVAVIRDVLSQ